MPEGGKRRLYTLSFLDDDLERDFKQEYGRVGLRFIRTGLIIGIAMWILLVTTAFLAGIHKGGTVFVIGVGLMVPFLCVILVLISWAKNMTTQQLIGAFTVTLSGIVAEYAAWLMDFGHYGAGILIFIGFASFILFRLRFFVATIASIPMFLVFLWLKFHGDGSLLDLSFALLAMSLVALGGYRIENSTREAFYQRKRVTAEKLSLENEARERSVQELQTLAILKEREMLASELHDTVTQKLAYLGMAVESLQTELASESSEDVDRRLRHLARIAADAQVDVRAIIRDARSAGVLSKGLLPTLSNYLGMLESEYGMRVEMDNRCGEAELELQASQQVGAFKIVQEALNNSRKHSGVNQGRLTISRTRNRIRVEISDEGRGFDPKVQTTVNHYGLDIMKTRARQSGGTLTIHSAPGKGSNIALEYPVGAQSSGSTRSVPGGDVENVQGFRPGGPEKHGQRSTSILVVDDHDLFREGLCGLLRLGGYTVVGSASSAESALEIARNSQPQMVLLDIQMRGTDGIQATARFKEEFPTVHIILLTGSPSPGNVLRATKVGASAFLLKSIQSNELFETIDEVLAGQAKFGPEMARQVLAELTTDGDSPVHSIETLNARQREVLKMVAQGFTYKEIGIRLHLAESTIKFHMGEIAVLLQVRNKAEAARIARGAGL